MTDPQDIRSEESLIGAILVSPGATKGVKVEAEDFYKKRHGLIWDAATKCRENGGADPVTVAAELERRGELSDTGGLERLEVLAATVPAPGNAGAYAKRVKEKAEQRRIRRSAQRILQGVEGEDEAAVARAVEELGSPIRYVDFHSGEVIEDCPSCAEQKAIVGKLEDNLRAKMAQVSRLEGKAEKEARRHKLWDEIHYCFDVYKLATGHFGVTFTSEEFKQALPRWKQYGKGRANPCKPALKAICGIAFDPSSTKGRNGKIRVFDKWELAMRNQFSWEDFGSRVPGDSDADWWRALLALIQGNLK